jgi:hypothetical protein
VPARKVVWHVLDRCRNFVEDKGKWKGADIVFWIDEKDGKAELSFTHFGLVPVLECCEACSEGWGFYINDSLRGLIRKGNGQPDRKE